MIRINCKLLVMILIGCRRALEIDRSSQHLVTVTSDHRSTIVRVGTVTASVACQLAGGSRRACEVTLPMAAFASVPKLARQELCIRQDGDNAVIDFSDACGTRTSITERCVAAKTMVPSEPEFLISNKCQLGASLLQAASISDPGSRRYSLGSIRLRGSDGQIASTDSRQAFVTSGFAFPVDEVLIPGAIIARLPKLADCSAISVGRNEDWIALRYAVSTQRWLVDLKVQEGRFPNIDQCFPAPGASKTELVISDSDAEYLLQHLASLMGKSDEINPLTIDLVHDRLTAKRLVQLRFRPAPGAQIPPHCLAATEGTDIAAVGYTTSHATGSAVGDLAFTRDLPDAPAVIELTLTASSFAPLTMCIATDSHHLLSALRLGFRRIQLQSAAFPIFSHTPRSKFVWSPLHDSLTMHPSPSMTTLTTATPLTLAVA